MIATLKQENFQQPANRGKIQPSGLETVVRSQFPDHKVSAMTSGYYHHLGAELSANALFI